MNPMQARAILDQTAATCSACKFIEEDLKINGKLTDHPYDYNEKGGFPVSGKIRHLELERMSLENR